MIKKLSFTIFFLAFVLSKPYAQSNQTVPNGGVTKAENFIGTGCSYHWVNSNPSIGLPANGNGNIPSFTAINTGNSAVTATITVIPASNGLAYITNLIDGTVSVINTADNTVVNTISVGYGPVYVAISPDGSRIYVANSGLGFVSSISVIDAATDTVIWTIQIVDEPCYGLAVSPDGSKLYIGCVGSSSNGSVTVVNTANFNEISYLEFHDSVFGIALSPNGTWLYATNIFNNSIAVINTTTNTVAQNITVGTHPDQVKLSPDGNKLYVCNQGSDEVSVINTETNTVIATIPVGSSPYGISISPDGSRIYVANSNSNNVSVINGVTNTVMSTIAVGTNPFGISVSPDGNFVYVVNKDSNNVSVINATNNLTVTTVPVGSYPGSLGSFISAGVGCNSSPVTFTITVTPPQPIITANLKASGSISACAGTPSASPDIQQFSVSGNNLNTGVTAAAPTGFELSLALASGYGSSVTLNQSAGSLTSTIIYVRSAAAAGIGNITGHVTLSSAGAANQEVEVSGIINAVPTVNTVAPQSLANGAITTSINFTGTATTFSWTNDAPGIGLAASGTGDIPSFAAINNTNSPVTATITVVPLNGTNCNGTPVKFTITVNPMQIPAVTVGGLLTPLTTIYGTASPVESFTVSGTNIISGILVTPPKGFEVSADGAVFNNLVTVTGVGNISPARIYIRLASSTSVGNYTGNVIISANNAANENIVMPVGAVTPALLIITADDKTRPFGALNPVLTVNYSGFVNNDDPAKLAVQPQVTTPAVSSSAPGEYPIIVDNAASSDYTFKYNPGTLTVVPYLSMLLIPNVFTPNGDGRNDTWEIKNMEYYPGLTVNIFDRWGQKIFSSVGYDIPWDGKYKGKVLPPGTFYYIIDRKNGQAIISGWVTIIR